ncbi:MAG: hypothetical protein KJN77_02730 [Gammaproteobacteria bacterium]|nr:hypothetical protein [Gammaproteobacteria bacterium]
MSTNEKPRGRLQLTLLALVFFGPLILATWLYFGASGLQPSGKTNHGELLQPIVALTEALPGSLALQQLQGQWLLIYTNDGACDATCDNALYTLRQSRLMLGNDMDRLLRVYLHGEISPDAALLDRNYAGTIAMRDGDLSELLSNKTPAVVPTGGYYLVDPLGNLVMYFRPDIDPAAMVDDISHLLELSRIG